jgi:Tol biopolymer transport system component
VKFPFFHRSDGGEGRTLLYSGRLDEAMALARKTLARSAADPDALILAGSVLFLQGRPRDAKEHFQKALKKPPTPEQTRAILQVTNYRRLASEGNFNTQPSFSSDGKWVVFACARKDTDGDGKIGPEDKTAIYATNVTNGVRLELVSDRFYNSQPAFSPDGRRIAFLSVRQDVDGDGKIDLNDPPGLYLKDLDSLKEECLVPPERRPKHPSFSPDGQWVLCCAWNPVKAVFGVYLFNLRTRTEWPVQTEFECNFPSFSADGRKVLYTAWRRDTNGDGRIDLNDNTALCCTDLLTNQESVLAGDQFSNSFPAFSPSGDSIVYLSRRRDTNNDGVVDALDNSGIYRLTLADRSEKMIVGDEHYAKFPAFSSDGKTIAFIASLRSDARQEKESTAREYFRFKGVYTCDPDGKNRREILSPQFYGCRFLAASPRANRVVFTAWRKDTNRGLYVAPLDALPDRDELLAILEENL